MGKMKSLWEVKIIHTKYVEIFGCLYEELIIESGLIMYAIIPQFPLLALQFESKSIEVD